MEKFIKNLVLFFIICLIFGELIIRFTHTVSDIPRRTIDKYGIQKYYPNQSGYWKGGYHKWIVNKLGWPGELPKSYDNLVTVIGDSYIENFMNPNECHQSILLKKRLNNYNFIEAGRSGVSFIEAMEISKQFDTLNPKYNLIYVNDNDFYESITSVKPALDITQLDLQTDKIVFGQMKSPGLKKILYNWKLLYYFYNRFPINFSIKKDKSEKTDKKNGKNEFRYGNEIFQLINYIKLNYSINNKILVFHPNSELKIIEICKKAGFEVIVLNSDNDESWSFEHDSHWTCYGHARAANQIADFFFKYFKRETIYLKLLRKILIKFF